MGRLDRKALPAPDSSRPELESAFVPAKTPTEQKLAAIWADGVGLDKVGIHDNYFDLGGASLQSLDIISKGSEAGYALELEMLFEFQTIAELAAAIDARATTPTTPEQFQTTIITSQEPVLPSPPLAMHPERRYTRLAQYRSEQHDNRESGHLSYRPR